MTANIVSCSNCGAPVSYKSPSCAYCRAPLTWKQALEIDRGETVYAWDLARGPLEGMEGSVAWRDGQAIQLGTNVARREDFGQYPIRDACVSVRATCPDRHGGFGVMARMHSEGRVATAYALEARPLYRGVRLVNIAFTGTTTMIRTLRGWELCPAMRGVGEANEIELRCADSILQAYVNGQHVLTAIDAVLGFGMPGWMVFSAEGSSCVVLHSVAVMHAR